MVAKVHNVIVVFIVNFFTLVPDFVFHTAFFANRQSVIISIHHVARTVQEGLAKSNRIWMTLADFHLLSGKQFTTSLQFIHFLLLCS